MPIPGRASFLGDADYFISNRLPYALPILYLCICWELSILSETQPGRQKSVSCHSFIEVGELQGV